jgi:hypothetical protein
MYEEKLAELRAYYGEETAQLRETHAREISKLQGAMDRALQAQRTAHEGELAQLRAYYGEETAQLREVHAREISRLQGAMDRALQTQQAAQDDEIAQLREHHGEETSKLLGMISQMKSSSDEGMVEFDELEELWNKALKSTNAALRRRIKALETQVFENPEVTRLKRKVNSQRNSLNRAARTIEILSAHIGVLEGDPSVEVQKLMGMTRP